MLVIGLKALAIGHHQDNRLQSRKLHLNIQVLRALKSIDDLGAQVKLGIKVAVFNDVLLEFLNKFRYRVKILYKERNGFCICLGILESERFTK